MVPGLLGLLGGTSAGLAIAPALRALTWPFLVLTVVVLARGRYLELAHAPGAVVVSDQAIAIPGAGPIELPSEVSPGRYFMLRMGG